MSQSVVSPVCPPSLLPIPLHSAEEQEEVRCTVVHCASPLLLELFWYRIPCPELLWCRIPCPELLWCRIPCPELLWCRIPCPELLWCRIPCPELLWCRIPCPELLWCRISCSQSCSGAGYLALPAHLAPEGGVASASSITSSPLPPTVMPEPCHVMDRHLMSCHAMTRHVTPVPALPGLAPVPQEDQPPLDS